MAFQYLTAHPRHRVRIVPCGIHHQQSHLFRSRVGLEFGAPIDIPPNLIALYNASGEGQAIAALKSKVQSALHDLTFSQPDIDSKSSQVGAHSPVLSHSRNLTRYYAGCEYGC
jgi:glycerol-3-phosphate O-acyltransferase / dihydroxyacetone phosphate acyltransferase